MSVDRTYRCDGPGCAASVTTAAEFPTCGWVLLDADRPCGVAHFCDWDCVLGFAAAQPVPVVVGGSDD